MTSRTTPRRGAGGYKRTIVAGIIDGIVYGAVTGTLFAWRWPHEVTHDKSQPLRGFAAERRRRAICQG